MTTKNELKKILDAYISKLVWVPGNSKSGFSIFVNGEYYQTAKYACTTDEKDFIFHRGVIIYKGFVIKENRIRR